jgi:hypothetical protein
MKSVAATTGWSEGKVLPVLNAFEVAFIDLCSKHSVRAINLADKGRRGQQ